MKYILLLALTACAQSSYSPYLRGTTYFGYYGSTYEGQPDYTEQFRDHTNVVFVGFGSTPYLAAKLEELRQFNLKAIINIEPIFFDSVQHPKASAMQTWVELVPLFASYQDTIVSFYIADEPGGRAQINHISPQSIASLLSEEIALIKASFPNIATSYIEDGATVTQGRLVIPNGIDWAGIDCYDGWNECGTDKIPMPDQISIFQSHLNNLQRIILVPPALTGFNSLQETDLQYINKKYAEYVSSNAKVVALLPFMWQSTNKWTGANALPNLLIDLKQISNNFRSLH